MASHKRRHSEGSVNFDYPHSSATSQSSLSSDVLSWQQQLFNAQFKQSPDVLSLQHSKRYKNTYDQLPIEKLEDDELGTYKCSDNITVSNSIKSTEAENITEPLLRSLTSQEELDKALISACQQGLLFLIQNHVRLGANIDAIDMDRNTPLLICARNGFVDIVSFLLFKKADVNAFNSAGDTALILSMSTAGSSRMAKVLLAQKAINIAHQNNDGYTALMRAIEFKDVNTIMLLVDKYWKQKLNFNDAVNYMGQTAEEIAEKCELKGVVQMLNNREKCPLLVAAIDCDLESFDILLDCQLLDKFDKKTSINAAIREILCNCMTISKQNIDNVFKMIKRLLDCGALVHTEPHNDYLLYALTVGDIKLLELMCQHTDLQKQSENYNAGTVALIAAAQTDQCDFIELLLKYKAEINHTSYLGSPLDSALDNGHVACAQFLIQQGAIMDISQAFTSAVEFENTEYLKFLFENYKSDIMDCVVNKPMHFNELLVKAARLGNIEIITHLLDTGADVNSVIGSEYTPLSVSKDINVAKFLISRGANIDQTVSKISIQHLFFKASDDIHPDIDVLNLLLECGSSVHERDINDKTLLIAAASKKENVAVLQTLLDHGANFDDQDKDGNNAIIEAVNAECPQNLSFLLKFAKENGNSINVQNKMSMSPLMCAVKKKHVQIIKLLLDSGADVNMKDSNGDSPLFPAVNCDASVNGKEEMLTLLIAAGSDLNCQNNFGFSPLMYAAKYSDRISMVKLLEAGADVNTISKKYKKKTAISLVKSKSLNSEIISCLRVLAEYGADTSYVNENMLKKIITHGMIDITCLLMRNGLAPYGIFEYVFYGRLYDDTITSSPLFLALKTGNVALAKYFMENLFLTESDLSLFRENRQNSYDQMKIHSACRSFVEGLISQPLTLFQLAFVHVSSDIGALPGRKDRVSKLPLPELLKNKLLFRSEELLNIPEAHTETVFSSNSNSDDDEFDDFSTSESEDMFLSDNESEEVESLYVTESDED